jgi:hypothetical protein
MSYSLVLKCTNCGHTALNGLGTGSRRVLDKIKCGKCGKTGTME